MQYTSIIEEKQLTAVKLFENRLLLLLAEGRLNMKNSLLALVK